MCLIEDKDVLLFLFGSRSKFDSLCESIVDELKISYPEIRKIAYTTKSEVALNKQEAIELESFMKRYANRDCHFSFYDGSKSSDRVKKAGRASYVERNQEMIDDSDFCIFYYNPEYNPPERKYSKRSLTTYQPKSGTKLAFEYAQQKKKNIENFY